MEKLILKRSRTQADARNLKGKMHRIFSCRDNLPAYIGHYPGDAKTTPGLLPRKLNYFYEVTPPIHSANYDKISSSESSQQLVDTSPASLKKDEEKSEASNPTPELDLEKSKPANKRKLESLFKVFCIFIYFVIIYLR